ncbi:MAG TPA: type VI secretion system baseplate subunit TssK [Verrucomicrobiae bacterium]|nr:type VI secretion system baseplate subunit TssK [Verrucomicrobiae bacterium]
MHVHWHEGLFLQPHHLQLMQRRLLSDIRGARALFTPFGFGVLESRLSPDDLADGRIRFERLRAILPSGQEVFFPDDANLPPLDIKAELARGSGALEVVLAAPLWSKNRANAFRPGESADPRVKLLYIPEEAREVADENNGDNKQAIHIRKVNARVALKGDDLSDMEFLPLLRVLRAAGEDAGKPRQDPEFAPPCLLLRSSPALHDLARDLVAQLNASREQLRIKAATGGLGIEVKWELTLRLSVLNRFCASLPSLIEEGWIPPFTLYLQLRELLGELLALHPAETLFDCRPYNHLDPLPAFKELDRKIRAEIIVSRASQPLRVGFEGDPGRLRAALEAQHFEKPTGYFLGIKTKTERTKLALYITDGNKFKFMPRSLEDAAIFGVELKEENYPPLELPGQSDLHYFRVLPSSNQRRWDKIKDEKAASLVWNKTDFDLSDATFTLYMTLPT